MVSKIQTQHKATFNPHTIHPVSDTTEKAGNPQLPCRSHSKLQEFKMLTFLCIERLFYDFFKDHHGFL